MSFRYNSLYNTDGYKPGHQPMLAIGTTFLYGTWIPRSLKYAPEGIKKAVSLGQRRMSRDLIENYEENFFNKPIEDALQFIRDLCMYLDMEYDGEHFLQLHKLGYLPICIKALPEGIETNPGIPHMTFINTVKGYGWLTLYVETIISSMSWKASTSATLALQYRRVLEEWVEKTDKDRKFLIPFLCHDFSARGLSPYDMISSGLGHAICFRGSDTLPIIPAARYFYGEPLDEVCINSVLASEHSVSTTKIFTVGEKQMIIDWLKEFPKGILSIVADTFDLWKLLIEYLADPEVKALVMARDGKLVVRPDSGDPVDIICGKKSSYTFIKNEDDFNDFLLEIREHQGEVFHYENVYYLVGDIQEYEDEYGKGNVHDSWNPEKFEELLHGDRIGVLDYADVQINSPAEKGVIEILADIYGTTTNSQGYKVLDSHIGAIYGDSITLDRQLDIYSRLEQKGFACTNIVLGIGSFTYQFNTRDTLGFAAKGAWFATETLPETPDGRVVINEYDIYKDPITDDGTKKSLKGRVQVFINKAGEYDVKQQCTLEEEQGGELQIILKDGKIFNQQTLTEIRKNIDKLI